MKVGIRIWNVLVALSLVFSALAITAPAKPVEAARTMAAQSLSSPYTQNFNNLEIVGGPFDWLQDNTISGWYSNRTSYYASSGTSTSGGLYSFGSTGSTDRALGSMGSNSTGTIYTGVRFVNDTGAEISFLDISYIGEQWRDGGNTTQHKLSFSYRVDSSITDLVTGVWTNETQLDFTGPIATSVARALDGNDPANRVAVSYTLPATIPAGYEIMLRWTDLNDAGNDHGLSVDDLSVGVPDLPPSVVSTVPANDAVDVALDANITVTFSEPVTLTGAWYDITCDTSGTHTGTVDESGDPVIVINPDVDFVNLEGCVGTIFAAGVADEDLPADPLGANYTFAFTTVSSDAPPTVVSTNPADLETNVALDSNIAIEFSEPVTLVPDSFFDIYCDLSGEHDTGAVVDESGDPVIVINPALDFVVGDTCTVTVLASGVTDEDGVPTPMTSDYQWTFTTPLPDPAPTVTAVTPLNNATLVPLDSNLTVTFS
ncbi:MAG TPA: Ig-like domain-containing protein, partial [Anaerolineaceae bacterium]|nr:Ig-like domain-containing protein [Anaerolineaceae bacterium]HQH36851.1 Ig-like domain-containing protein [Anaerolineaceae bacterium]